MAGVLKVPVEAIKNFREEAAINIIANTSHDDSFSHNVFNQYACTFNPMDKFVELYEQMLKIKAKLIDKLLNDRK